MHENLIRANIFGEIGENDWIIDTQASNNDNNKFKKQQMLWVFCTVRW